MSFIQNLIKEKWLKTPRIITAFQKIKRADFLPLDMKNLAESNTALPIGFSQTISQSLVVAFMMEQLEPKAGDKILDIGSGSGWTSALLAEIVGPKGRVVAVEIIPELKEFGEKNVLKYNFIEKGIVSFICADGSKGYKQEAPYDKILASAALAVAKVGSKNQDSSLALTDVRVKEDLSSLTTAREIPSAWKKQLKVGGIIVAPVGNSIWRIVKKLSSRGFVFEEMEYPGFIFVPLVIK
jgi:protein-L-isoaspartate(D-aspartate) O-methyltransferase